MITVKQNTAWKQFTWKYSRITLKSRCIKNNGMPTFKPQHKKRQTSFNLPTRPDLMTGKSSLSVAFWAWWPRRLNCPSTGAFSNPGLGDSGRKPSTKSAPNKIPCCTGSPGAQSIETERGWIPFRVSSIHQRPFRMLSDGWRVVESVEVSESEES